MKTYCIAEAGEFLKTDASTVYALIDAGRLPAAKIGRAYVILEDDLADYLVERIREQTAERVERAAGQGGRTRNKSEASQTTRYRRRKLPVLPDLPAGAP